MNKNAGSASGVFSDIPTPVRYGARRKAAWLGIGVVLASLIGTSVWATTAPLASAVIAQGEIIVSGKRKQVQHREGGIIQTVNVRDGDSVREGDVLIVLEDQDASLKHTLNRDAYLSALATRSRLIAERDQSSTITFHPKLAQALNADASIEELMENEREVFATRRRERDGQVFVLRQRVAQIEEEINGYEAEQASAREQRRIAAEELKTVELLLKRGYTTRTRLNNLEREAAELDGRIGKLTSSIAKAKASIGETELQILQTIKQHRSEVFQMLREVEERISDVREKASTASDKLDKLRITAPASGKVVNMNGANIGAVLRPGDTLLEIVPRNERLVIQATIRPVDVDQISVGMDTQVRVTAFKQRTTLPLSGKVSLVSADALKDERTGMGYYLAEIEVVPTAETDPFIDRLQPGMPAEVLIKTGQRTALAYLIEPIRESLNRAMRER